ncbi:MAG: hypothetical protein ACRD1H_00950 [Vicinamibacterales bacterium]
MSIVCTRRLDRAPRFVVLLAMLMLVGCAGGSTPATPTTTRIVTAPTPTNPTDIEAPTIVATAEPTRSPALEELLAPGPTLPAPDGFFFRNGDEIWYLPADGAARPVIADRQVGPWAQTRDGARAALVTYRDEGRRRVEELVIVGNDGAVSQPVYGQAPTSGAAADPGIRALEWSWDGQALALVLDDGSVATMRFGSDPFATRPPLTPVDLPDDLPVPVELAWAPSGAGVIYRIPADEGGSVLYVTPTGDRPHPVVAPNETSARTVRAFGWLPGRGRIAFIEDASVPGVRLPGSIFTVAPDGSLLELLVSSGRFAPAASIASLAPSPDGRDLAFSVFVPDQNGMLVFQSLWILVIDSGELEQAPVESGYRVAELWWSAAGLVWRGVDRNTPIPAEGTPDTGDADFILGRYDAANDTTSIIFQSTLAE